MSAESVESPVFNACVDTLSHWSSLPEKGTAIVRRCLLDAGLQESFLLGDVSKMRGYLFGWLGLIVHLSLRKIGYESKIFF